MHGVARDGGEAQGAVGAVGQRDALAMRHAQLPVAKLQARRGERQCPVARRLRTQIGGRGKLLEIK